MRAGYDSKESADVRISFPCFEPHSQTQPAVFPRKIYSLLSATSKNCVLSPAGRGFPRV